MTKKNRRPTNSDIERIAARILAEEHRQHAIEKHQQWKRRLAMSLGVALAAIIVANGLHIELMFKGAELILGAIAHFWLFGTAE